VAKKSSTNAVKKIDKQIEQIKKKRSKEEKESLPVINKVELDAKVKESTTKSAKKTSSTKGKNSKSTTKKNTTSASTSKKSSSKSQGKKESSKNSLEEEKDISKKKSTKTSKKKKKEETVSYETMRLNDLEKEMRFLYDKVNDANFEKERKKVSEIDYVLGKYIDDYAFRKELRLEIVHVKVKKTCTDILRAIVESIIHIFDNYLENSTKKIRIARWI